MSAADAIRPNSNTNRAAITAGDNGRIETPNHLVNARNIRRFVRGRNRAKALESFTFSELYLCPLWVISGHMQCKKSCLLYPKSGHSQRKQKCPLWAQSGHQVAIRSPRRRGRAARQIESERFRRPNLFPGGLRNAVIQK